MTPERAIVFLPHQHQSGETFNIPCKSIRIRIRIFMNGTLSRITLHPPYTRWLLHGFSLVSSYNQVRHHDGVPATPTSIGRTE